LKLLGSEQCEIHLYRVHWNMVRVEVKTGKGGGGLLLTIFIYNTNFLSICIPGHTSYHRFVSVVDHFFIPRTCKNNVSATIIMNWVFIRSCPNLYLLFHTLVQHPHYDESILVTSGQFLVMFIPSHHLHSPYNRNICKNEL
jgi:hypothetical protein